MALEVFTADSVGAVAKDLEEYAHKLRIIQGRMLSGQDVPQAKWNSRKFRDHLREVGAWVNERETDYANKSAEHKAKLERAAQTTKDLHAEKAQKKREKS